MRWESFGRRTGTDEQDNRAEHTIAGIRKTSVYTQHASLGDGHQNRPIRVDLDSSHAVQSQPFQSAREQRCVRRFSLSLRLPAPHVPADE